ncbi:MAG: AtpZ/AtpI family protein [Desulfovibrio sp.]|jgi:ATP synthase protein I|nr:AtpZ/AtpI family protein [Desulfovibrio sp.]
MLRLFRNIDGDTRNALSLAGTIGLHLISGIAVGLFVGYMLDQWLESSPWLTMIFLGFGIAAGFKNMYADTRRLLPMLQTRKEETGELRNPRGPAAANNPRPEDPPARKNRKI